MTIHQCDVIGFTIFALIESGPERDAAKISEDVSIVQLITILFLLEASHCDSHPIWNISVKFPIAFISIPLLMLIVICGRSMHLNALRYWARPLSDHSTQKRPE